MKDFGLMELVFVCVIAAAFFGWQFWTLRK